MPVIRSCVCLCALVPDFRQLEQFIGLQTTQVARHEWMQARQRQFAPFRKVQGPGVFESHRLPRGIIHSWHSIEYFIVGFA